MPYKCTQCGTIYQDGSKELREVVKRGGCRCGKKLLLYVRESVEEVKSDFVEEPEEEKEEVIQKPKSSSDMEWLDKEFTGKKKDKSNEHVHFDVETVQRLNEGEFKLDVGSLMSGKPYVVKAEEGVYYIHVPSAMQKKKGRKKRD